MAIRKLGNSGIEIGPLAFGGNVFGWSADEKTSFALLDKFVGAGLNMIDTADMYSGWVPGNQGGESETIIGNWLKRSGKRNDVVIATKVAKWDRHPGLSAVNIQAACDESLQRLQIDCIDVYFAHEDDASVPLEETLGAFARLIAQGKVRALGASNYSAERLAAALDFSSRNELPRYEVLQPEYNLYDRPGYEEELEPLARKQGIGVVSYFSLARGFLSGKYRSAADVTKSSARGEGIRKYLNPRGTRILAALDLVAARHTSNPAQIALAWLLARPSITAPIASATSLDQLDDLIAATKLTLSSADIAELDSASTT
ncbi:MAG: aldo/keto reductase [Dokdonella sp.]